MEELIRTRLLKPMSYPLTITFMLIATFPFSLFSETKGIFNKIYERCGEQSQGNDNEQTEEVKRGDDIHLLVQSI